LKPRKGDIQIHIRISGIQLNELQKYTGEMCEAYGLDVKIERYKGMRPISLYRWDLDCILDVLDMALADRENYPNQDSPNYLELNALRASLKQEYKKTYEG
jgi:hypothetical protein